MVKTILHSNRLLRFSRLSLSLGLSLLEKTLLLGCFVLRPVLEENLQERSCCNFKDIVLKTAKRATTKGKEMGKDLSSCQGS